MKNFLGALVIICLLMVAYVVYSNPQIGVLQKSIASKEPVVNLTPTPAIAQAERSEVHSEDGSMILSMKKITTVSNLTYSFYVTGEKINNLLIFSKTISAGDMSLPANSWSPDNNYLFIKDKEGTVSSFLVFKSTGEKFLDGNDYLNVAALFTERKIGYDLKDVTGWDAPGLMHIQTTGPSYWFDIANKDFLQLAR